MSLSSGFTAIHVLGKRLVARSGFVAVAALVLFGPSARANLVANGGFDTVGPIGSPVMTPGQGSNLSAAANWTQFAIVPESYIRTDLLPTTDPTGSGSMIHVVTDNGDWPPAHFGNGFDQNFSTAGAAVLNYDLYVVSGQVTGGLVLASTGAYVDFPTFGPTGGWIHVTDVSSQPVNVVAFETLTLRAGAEYYVDNVVVTSTVPEPTSLVLAGIAVVGGIARFGARRRLSIR
jgi:hypothetical protein